MWIKELKVTLCYNLKDCFLQNELPLSYDIISEKLSKMYKDVSNQYQKIYPQRKIFAPQWRIMKMAKLTEMTRLTCLVKDETISSFYKNLETFYGRFPEKGKMLNGDFWI